MTGIENSEVAMFVTAAYEKSQMDYLAEVIAPTHMCDVINDLYHSI